MQCLIRIGLGWVVAAGLLGGEQGRAVDWGEWRGKNQDGVNGEGVQVGRWKETPPVLLWNAQVGTGFSSFVVGNERVYTAGNRNGVDTIYAFGEKTGEEVWKFSYPSPLDDKFFEGGPTSTPALSEGRLFWIGRQGDVYCLEAGSGKEIWKSQVVEGTEARIPGWGFSGSPVVMGKRLLLNVGKSGLALNVENGAVIWKSGTQESGYTTPIRYAKGGKEMAIFSSGKEFSGVDVETGEVDWEFRWLTRYGVNAADPILWQDQVFISSGYGKGAVLVDLSGKKPKEIWKEKVMRNQLNPSVRVGGYVFGVDGDTGSQAKLKCVNWQTGEEQWSDDRSGCGSVLVVGDDLWVLSDEGSVLVAPVSSKSFDPKGGFRAITGKCWTVPVVANGRFWARNAEGEIVCWRVQ